MRLAAVADIHIVAGNHERDVHQFLPVNDLAEVLVVAGDFTNHGMPEEMRATWSPPPFLSCSSRLVIAS